MKLRKQITENKLSVILNLSPCLFWTDPICDTDFRLHFQHFHEFFLEGLQRYAIISVTIFFHLLLFCSPVAVAASFFLLMPSKVFFFLFKRENRFFSTLNLDLWVWIRATFLESGLLTKMGVPSWGKLGQQIRLSLCNTTSSFLCILFLRNIWISGRIDNSTKLVLETLVSIREISL